MTNIARAWMKNPEALQRARRIVVMGGAFDVPGNTSATAEFNFFADPYVPLSMKKLLLTRVQQRSHPYHGRSEIGTNKSYPCPS